MASGSALDPAAIARGLDDFDDDDDDGDDEEDDEDEDGDRKEQDANASKSQAGKAGGDDEEQGDGDRDSGESSGPGAPAAAMEDGEEEENEEEEENGKTHGNSGNASAKLSGGPSVNPSQRMSVAPAPSVLEAEADAEAAPTGPRLPPLPPVLPPAYEVRWLAIGGRSPHAMDGSEISSSRGSYGPSEHAIAMEWQHMQQARDNRSGDTVVAPRGALLSAEQVALLDTVAAATNAPGSPAMRAVVRLCEQDAGLGLCLGHLVQIAARLARTRATHTPSVRCSLEMLSALASNPSLRLGLHLDRILPVVISATVHARGSRDPWIETGHWGVRRAAAVLLARLVSMFGGSYTTLRARVCGVLAKALPAPGMARLDPESERLPGPPLSTVYGALCACMRLGREACSEVVVPRLAGLEVILKQARAGAEGHWRGRGEKVNQGGEGEGEDEGGSADGDSKQDAKSRNGASGLRRPSRLSEPPLAAVKRCERVLLAACRTAMASHEIPPPPVDELEKELMASAVASQHDYAHAMGTQHVGQRDTGSGIVVPSIGL